MGRECRKCQNLIPSWIKIDGRSKSLRNRKYCLECSPWGGHNTKTNIDRPTRSKVYANWSEESKAKSRLMLFKRGWDRKKNLIELAGGACKKCGYNKCLRALTFHHVDPSTKTFALSMNFLWSKSWDSILAEFHKTELICMNCHAEIEDQKSLSDPTCYRNVLGLTD